MALTTFNPRSFDLSDTYAFTGSVSGTNVGGGSLIKISSQTASGNTTRSFTSGIDSTYRTYCFKFFDIHPASNDVHFQFQGSTQGASSTDGDYANTITSTVFEARHKEDDSSTSLAYNTGYDQAQTSSFQTIAGGVGNTSDASVSGELWLFNPSSTTYVKHFMVNTQYMNYQSPPFSNEFFVAGYFNTTSAINAIRFKFSSGNIDDGTITMYGIA